MKSFYPITFYSIIFFPYTDTICFFNLSSFFFIYFYFYRHLRRRGRCHRDMNAKKKISEKSNRKIKNQIKLVEFKRALIS